MWPVRFCHVCGKPISQIGSTGYQLSKWSYSQRKTCGSTACYSTMQTSKRSVAEPYEMQPIDYFITGQRYVSS